MKGKPQIKPKRNREHGIVSSRKLQQLKKLYTHPDSEEAAGLNGQGLEESEAPEGPEGFKSRNMTLRRGSLFQWTNDCYDKICEYKKHRETFGLFGELNNSKKKKALYFQKPENTKNIYKKWSQNPLAA